MKKISLLILIAFIISCGKDDEVVDNGNGTETVELNNEINDFVWKGLNSWYNWQADVPNLSDSKDDDINEYHTFLNGYTSPPELFNSLKFSADDFSWFIEDYEVQQQQFQGISKSFGFRLSLVRVDNTNNVIMYIQHVSTNSPADIAGFKRGDIIRGINGTIMTVDNYRAVLNVYNTQETVTFNFAENDGITAKEDKTITREVVADNPVYFTKVFDNIDGKKVGYLVYNGFRSSFNDELNAAFGELKSAGIQELVLDLRINGGGSVLTSAYLASMIYGEANPSQTFAELRYNSKHSNSNARATFFNELIVFNSNGDQIGQEAINRLTGITKLYVLASGSTASASEMIINGLRPFIDVKVVGTKTVGKNEGSITLYDSPESDYTNVNTANPNHKAAMQPIVFQIYNSLGQSDYADGFQPNILVEEFKSWNNILPFGDENEVVLKAALDDIRGVTARSSFTGVNNFDELIDSNIGINRFTNEMYIDNNFINATK